MKSKHHNQEFKKFTDALGKVLQVSHSEMQQRLNSEKGSKKPSKKRASSGRVSSDKD